MDKKTQKLYNNITRNKAIFIIIRPLLFGFNKNFGQNKYILPEIDEILYLLRSLFDRNGNRNGSPYHRVVPHTEEAHHLYVGGNR